MGKRMSDERLAVKRKHSRLRPNGRTAEMMRHIEWQEAQNADLRDALSDLLTDIECDAIHDALVFSGLHGMSEPSPITMARTQRARDILRQLEGDTK